MGAVGAVAGERVYQAGVSALALTVARHAVAKGVSSKQAMFEQLGNLVEGSKAMEALNKAQAVYLRNAQRNPEAHHAAVTGRQVQQQGAPIFVLALVGRGPEQAYGVAAVPAQRSRGR